LSVLADIAYKLIVLVAAEHPNRFGEKVFKNNENFEPIITEIE